MKHWTIAILIFNCIMSVLNENWHSLTGWTIVAILWVTRERGQGDENSRPKNKSYRQML